MSCLTFTYENVQHVLMNWSEEKEGKWTNRERTRDLYENYFVEHTQELALSGSQKIQTL